MKESRDLHPQYLHIEIEGRELVFTNSSSAEGVYFSTQRAGVAGMEMGNQRLRYAALHKRQSGWIAKIGFGGERTISSVLRGPPQPTPEQALRIALVKLMFHSLSFS